MRIISRRAAAKSGFSRYFTGKACTNGHMSERYVSDGKCVECASANGGERQNRRSGCTERSLAIADGKKTYMSGKKCVNGHRGERYTANALCVDCARERSRSVTRPARASDGGVKFSVYSNTLKFRDLCDDEAFEMLKAYRRGEPMQYLSGGEWFYADNDGVVSFDGSTVYRFVKPRSAREEWIEEAQKVIDRVIYGKIGVTSDVIATAIFDECVKDAKDEQKRSK